MLGGCSGNPSGDGDAYPKLSETFPLQTSCRHLLKSEQPPHNLFSCPVTMSKCLGHFGWVQGGYICGCTGRIDFLAPKGQPSHDFQMKPLISERVCERCEAAQRALGCSGRACATRAVSLLDTARLVDMKLRI